MGEAVSSQHMVKKEKGLFSGMRVFAWMWIASLWILCFALPEAVFAASADEEMSAGIEASPDEEALASDIAAFAGEEEPAADNAAPVGEGELTADTEAFAQEGELISDLAESSEEEDPYTELAASAGEDNSTIDFVLVLDNSGTMAKSDPSGLTVAAAKMFVDMLPKKNARVAVVEFGSNYGENAYSPEKYTNYVSVPFPLTDITSIEQKEACKQVIAQTTQDGDYTPVGYAFQAACDVLQQGGATPGDAGILLISDFRITGQKREDFLEDGYNYQSLVDAEQIASENEWQVYTLEMNFDGKNDHPNDYRERIAARIRSGIPEATGYGDYVPLHNAGEAQTRFAEIFEQFFDPNNMEESQSQTQTTDENGIAVFPFTVGDMVAELNVTLTCPDSGDIESLEIGPGSEMDVYDLTAYQEPILEDDRTITKEDRYITIKLLLPPPGDDWNVVVHGDAQTEVGMYALSIRDMEFHLEAYTAEQMNPIPDQADTEAEQENLMLDQADTEAEQENLIPDQADTEAEQENAAPGQADTEAGAEITVDVNSPIHFTASYLYDGQRYSSRKVYEAYQAVLEIMETGEQIPMTVGDREYFADIAFLREGTYTVKAIASGDAFRTGSIETGTCSVTIISAPEQIPEMQIPEMQIPNMQISVMQVENQVLEPGGSLELNCADVFQSSDQTPLTYTVTLDPASSDLSAVLEGDLLRITAGASAGKSLVTITAGDGSSDPEKTAAQSFEVEVINRPLELAGEEMVSISIQLGKDADPERRIEWADYFRDPDGFRPVIEVSEVNPDNAVIMTQDEGGMTLRADHAGKAIYAVTARDANDPSVSTGVQINVVVEGSAGNAIQKISLPAIAILIGGAALIVLVIVLLWRRFH